MPNAISISDLTKNFGSTRALEGLDLSVKDGEDHGFRGPNGAGKTTTIRVLLGLIRADSGDVELLGKDPWRDAVELHRRLAYVPGEVRVARRPDSHPAQGSPRPKVRRIGRAKPDLGDLTRPRVTHEAAFARSRRLRRRRHTPQVSTRS
jgi:energy-coupling factor transporter ATP-binding protein EcfA2